MAKTSMELIANQEKVFEAYRKAWPNVTFWKSNTGIKYRTVGYVTTKQSRVLCYVDSEGNQWKATPSGNKSTKCVGNVWQEINTSLWHC